MCDFAKHLKELYGASTIDKALDEADRRDKDYGTEKLELQFLSFLEENKPKIANYLEIGQRAVETRVKQLRRDVRGFNWKIRCKNLIRNYNTLLSNIKLEIKQSGQQVTVIEKGRLKINDKQGVDWICTFTLAEPATEDGFLLQHVQYYTILPNKEPLKKEFWEWQGDIPKGKKETNGTFDTFGIDPKAGSGAKTLHSNGTVMFFHGKLPLYFRPDLDPSLVPKKHVTVRGQTQPAVNKPPHFPINLQKGSPHKLIITWDDKTQITKITKTISLAGSEITETTFPAGLKIGPRIRENTGIPKFPSFGAIDRALNDEIDEILKE